MNDPLPPGASVVGQVVCYDEPDSVASTDTALCKRERLLLHREKSSRDAVLQVVEVHSEPEVERKQINQPGMTRPYDGTHTGIPMLKV